MTEEKKHAYQIAENFEWQNARVDRTFLGYEDHGVLTAVLHCQGECSSQGFGCRSLEDPRIFKNFVSGVLKALRVDTWEQVQGKLVRIGKKKGAHMHDAIDAIRPIVDTGPIFIPDDSSADGSGLYK